MGSVYKRGEIFWIKFFRAGKAYYESSGSEKKFEATRLLKLREGAIADGKFQGINPEKTLIDDLANLYLKDYDTHHKKSARDAERHAKLILGYFSGLKAAYLTSDQVTDYRLQRRAGWNPTTKKKDDKNKDNTEKKVSDATVNRELSALRRMYNLGMKHEPPLVNRIPNIILVKENNTEDVVFEHGEYLSLRGLLPDHAKVILSIAYHTGFRLGEILSLKWEQISFSDGTIRLMEGTTKNGEGRSVPMLPDLKDILERWRFHTIEKHPGCQLVCHHNGERVKSIRWDWAAACKGLGIKKKFKNLRNTAITNMTAAGIPEKICMGISGHKTRSVFDRYHVTRKADLDLARDRFAAFLEFKKNSLSDGYKKVTMEQAQAN